MFTQLARSPSRLALVAAGLAFVALGSSAAAAPPSAPDGAPPPRTGHRPPPFAYEACEGMSADATCSVELPDGKSLAGQCVADENDALFCMPEHMPKPPDRR